MKKHQVKKHKAGSDGARPLIQLLGGRGQLEIHSETGSQNRHLKNKNKKIKQTNKTQDWKDGSVIKREHQGLFQRS